MRAAGDSRAGAAREEELPFGDPLPGLGEQAALHNYSTGFVPANAPEMLAREERRRDTVITETCWSEGCRAISLWQPLRTNLVV